MFLPKTAEYALRAMAHLAGLPQGTEARGAELAEAADIPMAYLSKVLRKLVRAGLLTSRKGHHGGFALARPRARIRFLDVLHAADYEPDSDNCAFGWDRCNPAHPCPLHPAWARQKEQFLGWAATTTLADVGSPLPPRGKTVTPRVVPRGDRAGAPARPSRTGAGRR